MLAKSTVLRFHNQNCSASPHQPTHNHQIRNEYYLTMFAFRLVQSFTQRNVCTEFEKNCQKYHGIWLDLAMTAIKHRLCYGISLNILQKYLYNQFAYVSTDLLINDSNSFEQIFWRHDEEFFGAQKVKLSSDNCLKPDNLTLLALTSQLWASLFITKGWYYLAVKRDLMIVWRR